MMLRVPRSRSPTEPPLAPTSSLLVVRPREMPARTSDVFLGGTPLAPPATAVFSHKALLLRMRPEDLYPLPVLVDTLVTTDVDLKRLLELLEMIKANGPGLMKGFEIR